MTELSSAPLLNFEIDRRSLFRSAAAGGGLALVGGAAIAQPAAAAPLFPGHKVGRIYVGTAAADYPASLARTGPQGLHRSFWKWGGLSGEIKAIKADHAAKRIPWISFKSPAVTYPWRAIAAGQYDADIRARARAYRDLSGPVVVSYHHEPENDKHGETPAQWAAAWCRVHDIMKAETGLANVASAPALMEWTWNPYNKSMDPKDWATPAVLSRCHLLGINAYQTESGAPLKGRMQWIFDYLNSVGYGSKMVGLAETGATSSTNNVAGDVWWRESWQWMRTVPNRIALVSYFDSLQNNRKGFNWLLNETPAKLTAFKDTLRDSVATTL